MKMVTWLAKRKTEMSKDRKSLKQVLPSLPNGNYAISYSVLSADGHPIKGSYVISIGEETVLRSDMNQLDLQKEDNESVLFSTFYSMVRILYYIAITPYYWLDCLGYRKQNRKGRNKDKL